MNLNLNQSVPMLTSLPVSLPREGAIEIELERDFLPVIEEVLANQLSRDYLLYLRHKLDSYAAKNPRSK